MSWRTVVVVPCGQKPRNLPFLALLHDAVSTFAGKDFGEADLPGASPRAISASRRVEALTSTRLVSIRRAVVPRRATAMLHAGRKPQTPRAIPSRPLIGPDAPPLARRYGSTAEKGDAAGSQPTGRALVRCGRGADGRRARMPGCHDGRQLEHRPSAPGWSATAAASAACPSSSRHCSGRVKMPFSGSVSATPTTPPPSCLKAAVAKGTSQIPTYVKTAAAATTCQM